MAPTSSPLARPCSCPASVRPAACRRRQRQQLPTPGTTNRTLSCAPPLTQLTQHRHAEGQSSCLEGGARGGAPGSRPDTVACAGGVGRSRRLQAQQAAHLLYGEGHLQAQAWSLPGARHKLAQAESPERGGRQNITPYRPGSRRLAVPHVPAWPGKCIKSQPPGLQTGPTDGQPPKTWHRREDGTSHVPHLHLMVHKRGPADPGRP